MDNCLDNRRTRQAISSVLSNNKWSWPFNAKRWGSLYRLQFLEQILFILNVSQLVHVWKHCVQHNLQESCECISYVYLSWNYIYPPPEELSHKVLALISFTSRHFFAKMRKGDPTLSHIKDVGCGQNSIEILSNKSSAKTCTCCTCTGWTFLVGVYFYEVYVHVLLFENWYIFVLKHRHYFLNFKHSVFYRKNELISIRILH